jgi:hypothetical protein
MMLLCFLFVCLFVFFVDLLRCSLARSPAFSPVTLLVHGLIEAQPP